MTVQDGNRVKIHYCGKLIDGTIFDDSSNSEPLQFTMGTGQVIPGFENGIKGMKVGEKKEFLIPCAEAYGERSDDFILEFKKSELPEELDYRLGLKMQLELAPELNVSVEIIEIKEDSVVFDANHQLADQDLVFEVELLEII